MDARPGDHGTGESPDDAIVEFDDIYAGYGETTILHGITEYVREGGITVIIGPNGAGKSTLLRAVFGLIDVSSGHVRFKGEDVTDLHPQERLERGIAFLMQESSVFEPMTVRTNLELGAFLLDDDRRNERIDAVVEKFPLLEEKSGVKARTLSGGQRRLLEIARSLLLDPDLFLMDEPSIGLDPQTRADIFDRVERINESGTTVLMVEQNASEALEVADRAIVLSSGQIELTGDPQEVLEDPQIRRLYLGG
ncbi:ABC transporter ATP-binding protein [Halobacteriales archaeon QS_8_69_26]|nr:MAG: ABC transporter ATP-binding protein [Halobacteriales archaeon QS_8_69_26]